MIKTRRISCFILGCFFSTLSTMVIAEKDIQALFNHEEAIIKRTNTVNYQPENEAIKAYPLYPYLEQKFFLKNLSLERELQIASFLETYQSSPLDWQLRRSWLNYLARRNKPDLFIKYFKPTSNAELNCRYIDYRLAQGGSIKLHETAITSLWLSGKSQPKQCDDIFEKWTKAGFRSQKNVLKRIELAATEGKHTLIPYLTTLLPEKRKYLGELWLKVRKNPNYVKRLKNFPYKNKAESDIIVYGLKRLIWREPDSALKIYQQAVTEFKLSHAQQQEIIVKFATALASKNHDAASEWLHRVDDPWVDNVIVQWRITNALRTGNWLEIKQELTMLPKEIVSDIQWQYWLARSLEKTNDSVAAQKIYEKLAINRHYYGFLAAGKLNKMVSLDNNPINVTQEEINKLFSYTAGNRAFALFDLGRFTQARREWNYWMEQLSEREKLAAAKYSHQHGWYDRAIMTLADVGYLNDVELRFPNGFNKEINEKSVLNKINPAWAFAIVRRESAFMTDANSPAGARGLMQLLPSTADQMNRKKLSRRKLFEVETNTYLGTKYLRYLLSKHDENQLLATAAYNAGSHRVNQWLRDQDELPADVWIETIPYKETRDYVKSVMAYQQIYQLKTGDQANIFKAIVDMKIGG